MKDAVEAADEMAMVSRTIERVKGESRSQRALRVAKGQYDVVGPGRARPEGPDIDDGEAHS